MEKNRKAHENDNLMHSCIVQLDPLLAYRYNFTINSTRHLGNKQWSHKTNPYERQFK